MVMLTFGRDCADCARAQYATEFTYPGQRAYSPQYCIMLAPQSQFQIPVVTSQYTMYAALPLPM